MSAVGIADQIRTELAGVGGRISEDIGLGRVVGEVLAYLYFSSHERTAVEIENDLGLSKGAVSVAVRQLENLGLVRKIRRRGERKNFYRTMDNLAVALRQGILGMVRQKLDVLGVELENVEKRIETGSRETQEVDIVYIENQLNRAKELRQKAANVIDSPLLKFMEKL